MNPLFEVIPAIDIQNGKTVQLVGGLRGTEKYYGDPIECALQWEEMGAKTTTQRAPKKRGKSSRTRSGQGS